MKLPGEVVEIEGETGEVVEREGETGLRGWRLGIR